MIGQLRAQLAADLAVLGVPVVDTWPDRVSPPAAFLVPPNGGSYISAGQTLGTYTVAIDVVLVVPQGSYSVALAALEELIEAVLENTAGDWSLSGVDSPSTVTIGAELLGSIVHLTTQAEL